MIRHVRAIAWPLWAVGLVLGVPAILFEAAWAESTTARTAVLVQTLGLTATGLVGLLLARRRPENSIGWLFLGIWVYSALFADLVAWAEHQALSAGYTGHTLATWIVQWGWVPVIGCVVLFPMLLFPTGRPLNRRWRRLVVASAIVVALWTLAFALQTAQYADPFGNALGQSPYGIHGAFFNAMPYVLATAFVGLTLCGLCCLVLRFRRGDAVVQAQMKWVVIAGLFWLPVLLFQGDHGDGGLIDVWVGVALAAIPVAMGVAILRYRLYDIDRIISRTASYAVVTGVLISVYAVTVTAVTRLLPSSSKLAVAAATLAAAALARPLLRRVQVAVDRRFNRSRYDALRTLEAFGEQLRGKADVDQVSVLLLGAVASTLEPRTVRLDLERLP